MLQLRNRLAAVLLVAARLKQALNVLQG